MTSMFSTDVCTGLLDPADGFMDTVSLTALDDLAAAWVSHGSRDVALVAAAARFAITSHCRQRRDSGELYVSHPLRVAAIVAEQGFDAVSVAAACCHDVIEDCGVSLQELSTATSSEVASVVDGLSKVSGQLLDTASVESASLTKFLLAVVSDVRVLVVKLADRLHNLRTSGSIDEARRSRSALEALNVFSPLAHRLGFEAIRREMEDLAFEILYPEECVSITEFLDASAPLRLTIESEVSDALAKALAAAGIGMQISSRVKHRYSLFQKLRATDSSLDAVRDLVGVRVVVQGVEDCYRALGVVHGTWAPVPGRFKDFVALPRPSGYRSLHTTIQFEGFEVEIQIRSEEMHLQAQFGAAAHFVYKSSQRTSTYRQRGVSTDNDLVNSLASATSPEEFLERLRSDLAPAAEMVVLTPKGKPLTLPVGAIVLDFAYKVHTDVGHRCVGAKVNGKMVPIRTELRTGDVVEVILGQERAPRQDWLSAVRTSRAREKIRKFIESSDASPVEAGKTMFDVELRSRGAEVLLEDQHALSRIAKLSQFDSVLEMLTALGSRRILPAQLSGLPPRPKKSSRPTSGFMSIEAAFAAALDGLPFVLAKCCNPVDVDDAVGFVSVQHVVSVHKTGCPTFLALLGSLPPNSLGRMVSFTSSTGTFWVEVTALDRQGLLRDLSELCARYELNISASTSSSYRQPDGSVQVVLRFAMDPKSWFDRDGFSSSLRAVSSVSSVLFR